MTITKEEISKGYDAVADKIGGLGKFYDRVVGIQKEYSGKVLDIGCGAGNLLQMLPKFSKPNTEFYGIDISAVLCNRSRIRNPLAKITIGDAENLPYEDNTFDFVLMTEALEHMLDHNKAIAEAGRVLKPNGIFIVTVPNRDWLQYDFYKPFIDRNEFQPVQDHYFRFKELMGLLAMNNLKVLKYMGSDNLFYYEPIHTYEQIVAYFLPFLYKKMKRLIVKAVNKK